MPEDDEDNEVKLIQTIHKLAHKIIELENDLSMARFNLLLMIIIIIVGMGLFLWL